MRRLTATGVADDLAASVDGVGLAVEHTARPLCMRTHDGPCPVRSWDDIPVTWLRHVVSFTMQLALRAFLVDIVS